MATCNLTEILTGCSTSNTSLGDYYFTTSFPLAPVFSALTYSSDGDRKMYIGILFALSLFAAMLDAMRQFLTDFLCDRHDCVLLHLTHSFLDTVVFALKLVIALCLKDVSLLSALAVWLGWLTGDTIYSIFGLWESKTRGMFILPPPLAKPNQRTPEIVRLQPGNASAQEDEEVFDDVEPYDFDSVKSFTFQRNHVYSFAEQEDVTNGAPKLRLSTFNPEEAYSWETIAE
ncbi:unnamed protein product [Oikopleura dioica]|uniref:Uncharacterized protein n=1 Tax=Oikopleura dioica TaxID=34765 RepID=E4XR70_OIKDI|nr:unnamed protein product [Oikopleura dioica]